MSRLSRAAALAATALVLATSTGCKKDEEKKAEPAAEPKPADTAAPVTAAPPTAAPTAVTTGAAPTAPVADPSVRPASVTDAQVKIAENIVAATNGFADALDAVKSDCKKATAAVKSEGKKIKASMDQTEKLQEQLRTDPAAMQWFQKVYGPKMMGALGKLGGVVNACRQDKDFEAAFKSLDLGGKPRQAPPAGAAPSLAPGATPPGSHGAMGGRLPTDDVPAAPRPK